MRTIPELSAEQRLELVSTARGFVGAPYRHLGRDERGIDCAGAIITSLVRMGVPIVDRSVYSPQPDGTTLRADMIERFGEPVWGKGDPIENLKPGDIVLMRWHQHPCHVALVTDYFLGGLALLHSWSESQRVVEHRLDDPWPRRLLEGWRP